MAELLDHDPHILAELNAIHPFREGNGRTQLAYLILLARQGGHPLALERMEPETMLAAMVASFQADEAPLAALIERLIEPQPRSSACEVSDSCS